jgi:GNAT superfamily N-acetyltransferase
LAEETGGSICEGGAVKARVATEADLPAIGEVLARAFENDPLWGWAFESETRERKLASLETVFGFFAGAALDFGWVRVTEGVEAIALWIPPGSPEMTPADEAGLPGVIADACEPQPAARVMEMLDAFERNHPHEPPHFYLSLLATHPDHAGKRHAVGLVADNLAEMDAADPPAAAFLESSNPRNVPRYERLGFHPAHEVDLVAGLTGTQMWRPPRGVGG